MLFNQPLPYFHTVLEVSEFNRDTIQKDILYKHGDYVLILNEKTLSVGLDESYLRGVEINFGQAAKAVREVLYHHFPDLLEELYWTPMYLEPTGAATRGSMECVGGYPIRFVPLDRINNDHWDEIIDWFNNKPALTKIMEVINSDEWDMIQGMLDEVNLLNHFIFQFNTQKNKPAFEIMMNDPLFTRTFERFYSVINDTTPHIEAVMIFQDDIDKWIQYVEKTIGAEKWERVRKLIVKLHNEQQRSLNLL